MRLFPRENYLKKIRGFYHDDGMIKVITGVRRCGKSCLITFNTDVHARRKSWCSSGVNRGAAAA